MENGQQFKLNEDVKIQNKFFVKGTVFEIFMKSNNEKENHLIVTCKKNGSKKSITNPSNTTGISQKQLDYNIANGVIELL